MRISPIDYSSLAVGSLYVNQLTCLNELPSDPSTPPLNTGYLYTKKNGSNVSSLFFENDIGGVTEITPGGGPAPSDATYLTMTANATLSNEVVVGAGVQSTLTNDITLQWNDASNRVLTLSQLGVGSISIALGTSPASTGVIRLSNNALVAWENAAASGVKALSVNSSDLLTYSGSFAAATFAGSITMGANNIIATSGTVTGAAFIDSGSNPATAGTFRLINTGLIEWRNAGNSANLTLTVNASDQFVFNIAAADVALLTSTGIVSTFKTVSSNPSTTGVVQMANTNTLGWRNAANSANLTLSVNSSNLLVYSGSFGALTMGGDIALGGNNITGGGTFTGSAAILGTTPAAAGVLRLPNATFITARNAANNADINMIDVNASNLIAFGVNLAAFTATSITATWISPTANPAGAGVSRFANNEFITARNAANNADINMIKIDGSNLVSFGANTAAFTLGGAVTGNSQNMTGMASLTSAIFSTTTANPAAAGIIRLANTEVIGWRNAANSGDATLTVSASTLFTMNVGLAVTGIATFTTAVGIGTTTSSVGNLRLPNNTSVGWRNAANSADLTLITNGSDLLIYSGAFAPITITTVSAAGLTVNGGNSTSITLSPNAGATGSSFLILGNATGSWAMTTNVTNGNWTLDAQGVAAAVITAVRTSAVAGSLTINAGLIKFGSGSYGTGTITSDASGNLTSVSDMRLKDYERPLESGRDALLKIHPFIGRWNKLSGLDDSVSQVFLSAQEVQAVLPEAVGRSGEWLSLDDRGVMALLIRGYQEHDSEIEEVKGKIALLEIRLQGLEAA